MTGWLVNGFATQPVYYSYGSGGTVYYENNVVYVNGEKQIPGKWRGKPMDESATMSMTVPKIGVIFHKPP